MNVCEYFQQFDAEHQQNLYPASAQYFRASANYQACCKANRAAQTTTVHWHETRPFRKKGSALKHRAGDASYKLLRHNNIPKKQVCLTENLSPFDKEKASTKRCRLPTGNGDWFPPQTA